MRQYGLSLDSKLTITTKRRVVASEPANEKELRDKYAILTNLWLLGTLSYFGVLPAGHSLWAEVGGEESAWQLMKLPVSILGFMVNS